MKKKLKNELKKLYDYLMVVPKILVLVFENLYFLFENKTLTVMRSLCIDYKTGVLSVYSA